MMDDQTTREIFKAITVDLCKLGGCLAIGAIAGYAAVRCGFGQSVKPSLVNGGVGTGLTFGTIYMIAAGLLPKLKS